MIYQNEQATITYDETVPCIIWTPTGFIKGDNFKEPFKAGMDYMEQKIKEEPNLCWLNDARKLRTVSQGDVKWLNENVNDRAYRMGVKRVGFVLPENIFGKLAIKIYVDFTNKRSDNSMEIKAFKTPEQAKEWLKEGATAEDVSFM